ncbi:SusC/RagA family TonB-linked outer membrane protein [Pedobacter sp. MW01-1-1]|uniref:SusC/RagA family TonB-linked outer membrane protein n=1 Tax=Pedobacter sp. MW01-1-1 TaxID=3383027 RepID=UPI003FEFD912
MTRSFTKSVQLLLLVLFSFSMNLHVLAQDKRITVEEALNAISKKYKTKFAYEHGIVQGKFTSSESLKAKSLDEALKRTLYANNLLFLYVSEGTYTIVSRDEKLTTPTQNAGVVSAVDNKSDEFYLTGEVLDETGGPLPGVTIKSNASNTVKVTDSKGKFAFFVPSNATMLSFSYVGYQTASLNITPNSKNVTVSLTPSAANQLQDVNVVSNGYQTLSKERITGAASVVTAKQLAQISVPNVLQRLEGLAAGVKIDVLSSDRSFAYSSGTSTGAQASLSGGTRTRGRNDYNMNIRGTSSLISETFPLVVIDGAVSEMDISTLNPNDVENITFLKDAAAASIWGVRAANGVIVITTKRGGSQKQPSINASVNMSISEDPDLDYYKTMTSAQQLAYEKELVNRNFIIDYGSNSYSNAINMRSPGTFLALKLKAGTITQSAYDAKVAELSAIDNRSQISQYFLQKAKNQQYNFSIGGGSDTYNYYYSASYAEETPFTVGNSGKRLTATLNNSWKLFKVATLSANLKGSFFNYQNNGISLATLWNSSGGTTLMPYSLVADQNGKGLAFDRLNPDYTATLPATYKNWKYNYIDELALASDEQKDNNYVAWFNLNVPIFKGLSATAQYTNERTFSNRRVFYDPNSYTIRNMLNYFTPTGASTNSIGLASNAGALSTINTSVNNYSLRSQLDYSNTFGKDHQVTALAGTELRETNMGQGSQVIYGYNMQTGFSAAVNYAGSAYPSIAGYNGSLSLGGAPIQGDKKRRFLSYFSNASYTYKDKYVLSGSVRYDDYNNFGLDAKYRATPLWSSGLKWNASKEDFLKNVSWISNLALRATYGVNGNISTDIYPFTYMGLASSPDYTTNQQYGFLVAPANPALRWEKTYVTNLALDFGFLDNRITGSVDVYKKNGKDILYSFPINNTYTGTIVNTLTTNSASLTGKGVDLSLNASILRGKDLTWSAGANFSYNTNEVTDNRFKDNLTTSYYSSPASISFVTGYPTDKLLVYRNVGLDANGLTQIYDENGAILKATTTTVPTFGALQYAGRKQAPYYGAINQSLQYKNFTLFVMATYQFGSVFLKPSIANYATNPSNVTYDLSADIANRWQKAGDELTTSVPGLNGNATSVYYSLMRYQYSDINVLKGDYIRLREISLSYDLPVQKFVKQIKGAKLGFAVRNLGLLWTANKEGYDPDVVNYVNTAYNFPAARSYNFSLNLNF